MSSPSSSPPPASSATPPPESFTATPPVTTSTPPSSIPSAPPPSSTPPPAPSTPEPSTSPPTPSTPATSPPIPSTSVTSPPIPSTSVTSPPTPSTPVTSPPTPSTPATSPPTPSIPATSPPTPSTPATSPPTPSIPATSPPTPSTPATSPPTPSIPSSSAPTPSTPEIPPPAPSTPAVASPTPSTPAISPPPSSSPPPPSGGSASRPAPSTPTSPSGGSSPAFRSPPPPSSGGGRPPSPTTLSPPSGQNNNTSKGTSHAGVVVGIVAGVAIIAILGIIFLLCVRKKKKKRDEHGGGGGYYVPPPPQAPPPGPKDGHYGVQAQHWQQNYPPPAEHYQVPKPAPPAGPHPLPGGPPYMSSGGASGSSYGSDYPLEPLPSPSPGISLGFSKSTFTYEELALATNGFSESNLLGQGGFGYVHKGVFPNGKEVAVKALKAGSGQGEREFQAEVEIISRVHHRYLVSLVGYCMAGSQRLLVYEFVPNGTLEFHLHGKGRPPLDWPIRLKISLGAAKGLAYLHEDCHPKIIHRDIKAANILVDYNFEAKVADFGLAKLSSDANTHISTRVMGTFGYMAPEYASSGKLTEKSDIYSFGVMLLELITGQRPVDQTHTYMEDSLVDWARPLLTKALEENNFDSLVDQRLENNYNPNEMVRMVACAAACVRHSARRRPRMSQVVRALEGEASLSDLNEGVKPGHSSIYSSDYDSGQYKEDMKRFRQTALASQELGSSEYGGTTSEYGLNPSSSSSEPQTTTEMETGMGKVNNS